MKLRNILAEPVDNSPLVLFRIFFGLLMFFESFGAIITGWVNETFVEVNFTFNFIGLDFLQAMVGPQMYGLYFVMGISGLFIALGFYYRIAIITFTTLWSVTYFAQKTHYNNHYYLVMLIGALMCFMPANGYASQDVKFGFRRQEITCPRWVYLVMILQVAIVYFYASIAKIYPDWLAGKPIEIWFTYKSFQTPFWSNEFAATLSEFFTQPSTHLFFAYGGILFDLLIVPMFLFNKWTRWIAVIASLLFHLTNSAIFQIGVFPYFALAFAVFFFKPETIRRRFFPKKPMSNKAVTSSQSLPKWVLPVFGFYFLIQIALPVRHHFMNGNVLWDETGHRLSWRMMLRTKSANTNVSVVNTETGVRERVNLYQYVKPHQLGDLLTKPDIQWQFAKKLKESYAKDSIDIEVYINSQLSVNGRERVQFTDPTIDVSEQPWNFWGPQTWVLPTNLEDTKKPTPKSRP